MSKKRRGRKPHHRGGRVTPKATAAGSRPLHFDDGYVKEPEVHPLAYLAELLTEDHPMSLLDAASALAWAADPKDFDLEEPERTRDPSALVETLIRRDDPSTTGLLGAFAVLLDDEVTRRRCAEEVARRRWSTPEWFRSLGDVTIRRFVLATEVLGDGENVFLELQWPTGQLMTVTAFVDHNLGGAVKDAFSVPITVEEMRFVLQDEAETADLTFEDIDPADARILLEDAIDRANRTWPPLESDTWPMSQPLLRWVLRLLPAGGTLSEWKEWSEEELAALEQAFLDSPRGRSLPPEVRSLVDPIIWYGTGYGHGDPYRWGPPRVEILLLDWFPRKVLAPTHELESLPYVLRTFIQWAHEEAGIPERLTAETLAVIDEYAADYLEAIADEDRPQGVDALLSAMSVTPQEDDDDWSATWAARMREINVRQVGGEDAYNELGDDPLPDEPLVLDRVPDDIRARVARVGGLVDEVCEDFFGDVELRTACRRILVDAAAGDPVVFRRRSKDEPIAGAVCWVVAKTNGILGHGDSGPMLSTLGLKGSVSQRAEPLLRAVGAEGWSSYEPYLGSPRYLTSRRRRSIIDHREGRWPR